MNQNYNNNKLSKKFSNPHKTADGATRATVVLSKLQTLWFNTGTQCNLKCSNCYIESSPINNRLLYMEPDDIIPYLNEIKSLKLGTKDIAFTGGEPFLNPNIILLLEEVLGRGHKTLVLTNAMKPMMKLKDELIEIKKSYGQMLSLRVSVDHYTERLHAKERGERSWEVLCEGLKWLNKNNFSFTVAGRTRWNETEQSLKKGFQNLFDKLEISLNAENSDELILFPEMYKNKDVPEITDQCWKTLGVSPQNMMCATSRMIVKRRETEKTVIMPCTLLAYDTNFELGQKLEHSQGSVSLNHPHCSRFCVLGGGSCESKIEGEG